MNPAELQPTPCSETRTSTEGTAMKLKSKTRKLVSFDSRAHEVLREMFDQVEDTLIRDGICEPDETEDYLCREFIAQLATTTFGVCNFNQREAEIGGEIFLSGLRNIYSLPKHTGAFEKACARQLTYHLTYYFRDYHATMTKAFIERLQESTTAELGGYKHTAFFQIAAATIPGVRDQIRREYRIRGLPAPMLVGDRVLEDRMKVSRSPQIPPPH